MAKRIRISELVQDSMTRSLVQDLASLGYRATLYAYREGAAGETYKKPVKDGKWRHRTRNLHDSFGSAVFVHGKLVEDSIRFVGPVLSRKTDSYTMKSGRDTLLEYFHSNPPEARFSPITLICAAAMYYTKFLEEGTYILGGRGRTPSGSTSAYKIRVISGARDYLDKNWSNSITDKNVRKLVKINTRYPDL